MARGKDKAARGKDKAAQGKDGPAAPARPGLLDRLTWLVLMAFLVLLAVAHS